MPLFLIFSCKRMMTGLIDRATLGGVGSVSDSGWFNSELEYLEEHSLFYVPKRADQKVFLLLDGHTFYTFVGLVQWAKERNIILLILPAHNSHILQPLHVGCYGLIQNVIV